jgi:transcriptional regulator with XRE-family HTH domain
VLGELLTARSTANLSQADVARSAGWTRSRYARFERDELADVGIEDLAVACSVLGLDVSVGLHPVDDLTRDRGQTKLRERFADILHPSIRAVAEVLLPGVGDRRAWDLLLRIGSQVVGVELETRVRDAQWLVRRMRERERDGGADFVLLVLSNSAINRRLLPEVLEALGPGFATPPRAIARALRAGEPLPGSGVLLI